jgi:NAD-dependent dihydropyrimidine dehydrogenase PreA subunit
VQGNDLAFHYVCTREDAWKLVKVHKKFWVSNCGCREKRGRCSRSRVDLCLYFKDDIWVSGTGFKGVTQTEVKNIFQEAEENHLVTRPFRNEKNMSEIGGICFCCDDCCEYFTKPGQKCDKGKLVEKTDKNKCADCGTCVDVCYFTARKTEGDKLVVNSENCYGCGLCADVCPEECIEMVTRK